LATDNNAKILLMFSCYDLLQFSQQWLHECKNTFAP